MKYYARLIPIYDDLHKGALHWVCLDSHGGFFICRDEQSAREHADARNAKQ